MNSKLNSSGTYFWPRMILGVSIFIAMMLIAAYLVMLLWNACITPLTSWKPMQYWQAIGALFLVRMLMGGFGRRLPNQWMNMTHAERDAWREKWNNLTPEEQQAIKDQWKERCKEKWYRRCSEKDNRDLV